MCEAFSKIFLVFLTSAFTVDLMIKVVPITASIQQSLSPSPRYYRCFFRIPRYYRNTISMPILIFFLQANFSPYGFVYTLTYCNHVTPVSTVLTVDFCYTYPTACASFSTFSRISFHVLQFLVLVLIYM